MKPIYIKITVLQNMFNPKTVAVIGASRHEGKVGNIILKNLKKSGKKIFPVNPQASSILGLKCYASVMDIKEKVDLAVIVVPSGIVPKVIEECGVKNIKTAMIISAGFGEIGNHELEDEVNKRAKMHGIRLIGPNCMGFINTARDLNATFFDGMPEKGGMAFISQSGALGSAMLDWAMEKKVGISYFFSIGNMVDIGFSELIEFLQKDKETRIIILYMESLKDGKKFYEAAKRSKKPIAVIKAGRSTEGIKAAASHTGALAGSDNVYSGVFRQCGILRIDKLDDVFQIAKCVQMNKIPLGKRILIVTNAGGPGVLMADACSREGLVLAKINKKAKSNLNRILPDNWSRDNPLDIVGDADPKRFREVLSEVMKKDFYDSILCILTPQAMTEPMGTAREIIRFSKHPKPVFACFMGGEKVKWAIISLESNNIPNFQEPEDACRTMAALIRLFGRQR
jgi:acetyl coenzyme A synthetase (ADP forming)-like protein